MVTVIIVIGPYHAYSLDGNDNVPRIESGPKSSAFHFIPYKYMGLSITLLHSRTTNDTHFILLFSYALLVSCQNRYRAELRRTKWIRLWNGMIRNKIFRYRIGEFWSELNRIIIH